MCLQVELGIIINIDQLSSALPRQNYASVLQALVVWSLAVVVLVVCVPNYYSQIEMECVFFICGDGAY